MKRYIKRFLPLFFIVFAVTALSCAGRIDGSLAANGSAALSVNISLEPGITALIQRMFTAGGQQGQVLDGASIARSMSEAPGVSSVSFRNTSPSAIEGQIRISQISEFLSPASGSGFITFEQTASGGRCVVNINRRNSQPIIKLLSSEIEDYLNALMAPIATGEEMTKQEYLELVGSFYNRTISNEISSSRIRASIEFPGTVTRAAGGTISGRRVNFDIPLLDLLVLETPMIYEVTWN
ncbi:MAG: hypothetical protein FWD28_07350 [Treponema sp.]|nr:hypothetical protein [Treponema sp.]